jgi:hypothetical protein
MDSINKNQPEENHKDLRKGEAAGKIKQLVEKANTCFFFNVTREGQIIIYSTNECSEN